MLLNFFQDFSTSHVFEQAHLYLVQGNLVCIEIQVVCYHF